VNAAAARKRLAEIGGAAPHEARHVAAAMLLGVPVVKASAVPEVGADGELDLGHVLFGPEHWEDDDVRKRALVTLVGEMGDRDDWPPPHPAHPSMRGKTPARLGNDGDRLWKAIEALGMDELGYELLVQEARELVKRRDFRRLEVGVGWLLEQGHEVGPELLERVQEITRQETKTVPASAKATADAGSSWRSGMCATAVTPTASPKGRSTGPSSGGSKAANRSRSIGWRRRASPTWSGR
jgi:hypothetical protein